MQYKNQLNTNQFQVYMEVKKYSTLLPSASKKALHRFLTVAAVAQVICKVSLHWYLSLLSWNQPWMQAWPFKLGVWLSSIGKRRRGCNQGNAKAKRPPTVTRWFSIELIQDGLGAVSICAILLPDIDLTNDRWLDQIMIRSWPDHEQIIKGISEIKAELLASSTIHFTASPFQSQTQVIILLYPCLR